MRARVLPKSSPSNSYWCRNLMTEAMKVWQFSGAETMAVKLRETQRRQSEGMPWWSQHLVVKSNFNISASELFTRTHNPDISTLLVFSCPYFVISTQPAMGFQYSIYFVIHPILIFSPRLHLCFEHLATPAHCVLSPNSPPSSYALKEDFLFTCMTFSSLPPKGK